MITLTLSEPQLDHLFQDIQVALPRGAAKKLISSLASDWRITNLAHECEGCDRFFLGPVGSSHCPECNAKAEAEIAQAFQDQYPLDF